MAAVTMLFPTVEYGLFFISVLCVSWLIHRWPGLHNNFLLAVSYLFYAFWNWHYLPLLIGVSLYSAVVARIIQAAPEAARKAWLAAGVIGCLAPLAYYKYTAFFEISAMNLCARFFPLPDFQVAQHFLPLGLSFFVFHAISLMVDAYRGNLKSRINLRDALLYVAFFPQLIAGPILRASAFLPQLGRPRNPQAIRMNTAGLLIIAGLFKKVIVANILATDLVNQVFADPSFYGARDTLLAIYGYAAQIYCDFSGYTDIATGCAMLLGYRFPRNFNAPYTAASPQDFWHRWHISLSTWLRDYLYVPLGGSRGGTVRTYLNVMATMVLGGLWHGANWTFVVWGLLHGALLVGHRAWAALTWRPVVALRSTMVWAWIARVLLFQAVCLGWVFFRSPDFQTAFTLLGNLGVAGPVTVLSLPVGVALVFGLCSQYVPRRIGFWLEARMAQLPVLLRGTGMAVALCGIQVLGPTGIAPFVYFQF